VKRRDDQPAVTAPKGPSVVRVGDRFNDPWMRAMIVSPSAQTFMRTTVYGVPDFCALGPYLLKPASTMMATFSEDPHRGMTSESFAASAVGFTRPVTFTPPRTPALREFGFQSRGDRRGVAPQVGETRLAANRVRARSASVQHAERMHVSFENRLLLAPFIGILLAQPYDHAQRLDVEAVGLGF